MNTEIDDLKQKIASIDRKLSKDIWTETGRKTLQRMKREFQSNLNLLEKFYAKQSETESCGA